MMVDLAGVLSDEEIDKLEGDEWRKAAIAKMEAETVRVPVVGGLCELVFTPGPSCGTDPDCHPGVTFRLVTDRVRAPMPGADGTFHIGCGVFSRSHAKALRDMIDRFLSEHAPVVGFGER